MAVLSPERPVTRPAPHDGGAPVGRVTRRDRARRLWPLTWALVLFSVVTVSTLGSLLDGFSWWLGVALLSAVVLCSSAAARSIGVRSGLATLIGALVWLMLLVLFFAPDDSFAFIVPTFDTISVFSDLSMDGGKSIASQGTPAEADLGIRFILAVGAGAFAVLLDAVAITGRIPAFVGVPAASIALIPGFVQGEVNLLALALCGAAYLVVLWADTRVRRLSNQRPGGVLGISAIAVVGALLFSGTAPGFNGASLLASSGGSVFGRGVSPLVDLGKDLRRPGGAQQFSYTTTTDTSLYFRLLTLDEFNGTIWTAGERRNRMENEPGTLLAVPGLSDTIVTEPTTTTIQVDGMVAPWLPVPFPSVRVVGEDGRWVWDLDGLTLSSRVSSARGQSYIAESVLIQPTREQLIAAQSGFPADVARFLELPEDIPPIITETVAEVTAASTNAYDRAFAIQQFLRSTPFLYSVEAPVTDGYDGDGFAVIAEFLEKKSGYCVHFSSAMAIMARMTGIPTRISLGYLPGDRIVGADSRRTYTVGTDDLHAWPELYFSGVGWVPFEPTPGRGIVPDYARSVSTGAEGRDPVEARANQRQQEEQAAVVPDTPASTAAGGSSAPLSPAVLSGAALVLLLILGTPAMTRAVRRSRRLRALRSGRAGPLVAWREISDSARDLGIEVSDADTPRAFAADLTARIGPAEGSALAELLDAVERDRFADPGRAAAITAGADFAGTTESVSAALRRSAGLGDRVRATCAPTSALSPSGGERVRTA